MARFNTQQTTISVTGATTLTYVIDKATILLTGSSGYTLTLASPTAYPGTVQTLYNSTNGNITLSSSGNFIGNGFTSGTSQTIPKNTTYTVTSDGTNYVITNNQGGPIDVTSGTFGGTLTANGTFTANSTVGMSPANANVTISPTGTGTVTISPAGTLTMSPTGALTVNPTGAASITGSSTLTLGTAGQTTTMQGNISASTSNQTVTLSPTGTGTVTISPAGALTINPATASTINNTSIGATTRAAGAFTTLGANSTATFTGAITADTGTNNQSHTTTGTGTITISSGTTGSINNMSIGASTRSSGAFTTLAANSSVTFSANTGSTNSTSGTLVVTGGVGVSENVYVGGTLSAATVTETSSIVYKENVQPIDNALDLVLQLLGVTYDRKDNKEHESGLIAEDVYKVIPDLVVLDKDGNPNSIKYSKISAYLVESIKTLKKEIDAIKRSVN